MATQAQILAAVAASPNKVVELVTGPFGVRLNSGRAIFKAKRGSYAACRYIFVGADEIATSRALDQALAAGGSDESKYPRI